jgi:hypothetical protein
MFHLHSAFHSATLPVAKAHEVTLHFGLSLQPALALLAGILILIMPRILNFVVAAYLIIVGLVGILGLRW